MTEPRGDRSWRRRKKEVQTTARRSVDGTVDVTASQCGRRRRDDVTTPQRTGRSVCQERQTYGRRDE